jgi:cytosine/adenosine deaminase-related metal-dependent hydrolase
MRIAALVLLAAIAAEPAAAQSAGVRHERLIIRNALVIDGAANPVRGPLDILIEHGRITRLTPSGAATRAEPRGGAAPHVIDAAGMYVMPGIIDLHGHTMFRINNQPLPRDYVYKLWLGHGITTIRDPGSGEGIDTMVAQARLSAENRITAPTIVPYATVFADTPDEARQKVRDLKSRGAQGLKVFQNRPDVWEALADEARIQGLPIATDMKIQEHDALDAARLGVRTIEHWYGIPDAAIPGPQNFPATYNYDNELDRFRWAADLWRQADSARLSLVLDSMLAHDVTWDPTFAVYEANRDLSRARSLPWFQDYAMPNVLAFFEPDPGRHGSYHFDWTSTDEVMWRNNMRIWMSWVREYARRGGNVTVGSDAGFIYHLYGFGTIRELELHQEAGFHPLEVIQQATANGAQALGLTQTGVIRPGFEADLAIVNGNPLHNLKVFYGTGIDTYEAGSGESGVGSGSPRVERRGGVRYTIKDGIVYDAPALLADVRAMVLRAKGRGTAP